MIYIKAFITKQKIRNRRRLAIVSDYLLLVEQCSMCASQCSTDSFLVEQCSVCASQCSTDSFLVEMARVELASENLFPKLSTSVVYLLKFPQENADKQALTFGSPLIRDKVQGSPLFTCTAK